MSARQSSDNHNHGGPATGTRTIAPPCLPLPGTWDIDDGVERRIGASSRSLLSVPMIFGFAVIWAALPLAPLLDSRRGDPLSFVLLPFGLMWLAMLAWLLWGTAMFLGGKVEVRLRGTRATIRTGLGRVGCTRRFDLSEFSSIREDHQTYWRSKSGKLWIAPKGHPMCIVLEGSRRLAFGGCLDGTRRWFLVRTLRPLLQHSRHCLACNYDLRATPPGAPCPECGGTHKRPASQAPS